MSLTQREIEVSRRVRQAREDAGLTQEDAAKALNLSVVGYGHYERATQPFGLEQLFQLSRILGKPVTWFLGLPSELDPDEDELLALYRLITDPNMKKWAVASLRALVASSGGTAPTQPGASKTSSK
ncbi:MAG: helix-turn-helix transcriptional regulator [Anaerolineae bacterium]